MMSIFSPRNSRIIDCTRIPFMPTHARSGARDYDTGALRGALDACDHSTHALADSERFQPGLLLARHAGFRLADVKDHVRAFDTFHGCVDDFSNSSDVFVVDSVAFGVADLLKNYLLRQLCGDPPQNAF